MNQANRKSWRLAALDPNPKFGTKLTHAARTAFQATADGRHETFDQVEQAIKGQLKINLVLLDPFAMGVPETLDFVKRFPDVKYCWLLDSVMLEDGLPDELKVVTEGRSPVRKDQSLENLIEDLKTVRAQFSSPPDSINNKSYPERAQTIPDQGAWDSQDPGVEHLGKQQLENLANQKYKEAGSFLDAARVRDDGSPAFITAAETFRQAAELLNRLIKISPSEKSSQEAIYQYWLAQSARSLASYHYQRHELYDARTHNNSHLQYLERALQLAENNDGGSSGAKHVRSLIPAWRFEVLQGESTKLSCDAREAWNSGQFMQAFDIYTEIEKIQEKALELVEELGPKLSVYKRICHGLVSANFANKAQAIVSFMNQRGPILEPDEITECLSKLLEAFEHIVEAREINPEPEIYKKGERILKSILLDLLDNFPGLQSYCNAYLNPTALKRLSLPRMENPVSQTYSPKEDCLLAFCKDYRRYRDDCFDHFLLATSGTFSSKQTSRPAEEIKAAIKDSEVAATKSFGAVKSLLLELLDPDQVKLIEQSLEVGVHNRTRKGPLLDSAYRIINIAIGSLESMPEDKSQNEEELSHLPNLGVNDVKVMVLTKNATLESHEIWPRLYPEIANFEPVKTVLDREFRFRLNRLTELGLLNRYGVDEYALSKFGKSHLESLENKDDNNYRKALEALGKMSRLKVFVGSSVEGLGLAEAVRTEFEHKDFDVILWTLAFGASSLTLESLENTLNECSAGVFIFTPDDSVIKRGEEKKMTRDNILFETGLFVGRHGRQRTFYLCPRDRTLTLPSDFDGWTPVKYNPRNVSQTSSLQDRRNAVSSACSEIADRIQQLFPKTP